MVVVGAGAIGLSAALALRDRGARVRLLEAERPGAGQSAGPGRIFRHIHDRPELVPLAVVARAAWRDAEERFGRPLLDSRGTLLTGEGDAFAAGLEAAGLPFQRGEAASLAPGLAPSGPGLLDPGGGVIDAEGYLEALAAELAPAIERVRATGLRVEGDGAVALTDDGPVAAGRVLVCAGAGTPALAEALGIELPVASTFHRRVTFRAGVEPGLPCLVERSGLHGPIGYATPLAGGELALGTGAADDQSAPVALDLTRGYFRRLLPGADTTPVGAVECHTTVLAGHGEAMGLYRAGPVALFAGGNLFKHAPALGPLLAEAVLEDRVDPVLEPPTGP